MENETSFIICPNCTEKINVNKALEDQIKKGYELEATRIKSELKIEADKLETQRKSFNEEKQQQSELVQQQVDARLKSEKSLLETSIRAKVDEEKATQLESLEKELDEKSKQLKDLNQAKADLSRIQREKDELEDKIKAEQEQKYSELLAEEKQNIKRNEQEKSTTELQKRDKLISDLNNKLVEAQNKLKQGSNKIAGEVKEIELRDFMKTTFPIDEIKDVPSGVNGADVLHIVKNGVGKPSGTIVYERKQTQSFGKDWVSKLKEDGRRVKADVCVLVTRAMPSDNAATHVRDGVWVCTFEDVKIISMLLRDGLIKQYSALESQKDKGTKMEMLYDYLSNNEFKNHILGIIDAFKKMDTSLLKEKEDAIKKFSEREAHIFQAKQSLLVFWGRVDGIATDSLSNEVRMLSGRSEQS
jgi:hypothetical protein